MQNTRSALQLGIWQALHSHESIDLHYTSGRESTTGNAKIPLICVKEGVKT